mmetsp:Transcript_49577/g.116520  ORF Transcript_49577/g.116520 Transcript_49577/m.116520 type:complete len:282 (-) Transcript_49577:319-1164(-)
MVRSDCICHVAEGFWAIGHHSLLHPRRVLCACCSGVQELLSIAFQTSLHDLVAQTAKLLHLLGQLRCHGCSPHHHHRVHGPSSGATGSRHARHAHSAHSAHSHSHSHSHLQPSPLCHPKDGHGILHTTNVCRRRWCRCGRMLLVHEAFEHIERVRCRLGTLVPGVATTTPEHVVEHVGGVVHHALRCVLRRRNLTSRSRHSRNSGLLPDILHVHNLLANHDNVLGHCCCLAPHCTGAINETLALTLLELLIREERVNHALKNCCSIRWSESEALRLLLLGG